MSADGVQLAMLAAQILTAGGTGGVLYTLGKLVAEVRAHGRRIEKLESAQAGGKGKHELVFG